MIRFYCILIGFVGLIFHSCVKNEKFTTITRDKAIKADTVYMSELINSTFEIKLPQSEPKQVLSIENPVVAKINISELEDAYLTILDPEKNTHIIINESGNLHTTTVADSLLNYLWHSNQQFILENQGFIFKTKDFDSIVNVFETFTEKRKSVLETYRSKIDPRTFNILEYQNQARVYSFLFYFGRVAQELEPENSFFDFIENLPPPSAELKSLPDIYLYKYEITYLRANHKLERISDFIDFIKENTESDDLSDFLKATYIKALIQTPSYWNKHEQLFNSQELNEVLVKEKNNRYSDIILKVSESYSKLKKGDLAADFSAIDKNGKLLTLKDFKGKVLFLDIWATWCGPCINQRPHVLELARKYEANSNFEVLLISVDSSIDNWLNFLEKEKDYSGINLFIENGMRSSFGNDYNIKAIPRYILIDKNGKILSADITEPSKSIELLIDAELKN